MLNSKEIKSRIKGVEDTKQITHAMQLISASKFKKAMKLYNNNHMHFDLMRSIMKDIIKNSDKISHPYFNRRDGQRVAFLVISSDKGLSGDYNKKLLDLADRIISQYSEKYLFTVGHIANDFFRKKDMHPDIEFLHIAQNPTLNDARQMTYDILDLYDKDLLDEIRIIYTSMHDNFHHYPVELKLLPIDIENFKMVEDLNNSSKIRDRFDFEPSAQEVIDILIPQYLIGLIYGALVQSVAAEHYSRMIAMKTALDNAEKMLKSLKILSQRIRQERITTEIQEICIAAENS